MYSVGRKVAAVVSLDAVKQTLPTKNIYRKKRQGHRFWNCIDCYLRVLVLLMTGVALGCVVRAVCWPRFYPNSHCIANKNGCLLRKALIPVAGWKFTNSVMCQLLWCSRGFDNEVHILQLLYNIYSKGKGQYSFGNVERKWNYFLPACTKSISRNGYFKHEFRHDFPIILQEGKTLLPYACGWNNLCLSYQCEGT